MDLSLERGGARPPLYPLYDAALALKARLRLGGGRLLPRDCLAAADRPEERRRARELIARVLALRPEERRRTPALLNAAGTLAAAAGDLLDAVRLFEAAAATAARPPDQALCQHNLYRAALELRDWPAALKALLAAAALQPEEFSPFPLRDYQPERILGAGGTGVSFLCQHRGRGTTVVVKALATEDLGRPVVTLFAEASDLQKLAHPAIAPVREWGTAGRGQHYLVSERCDGDSLDWLVAEHGPLAAAEVRALLGQAASALAAAHRRNVLHRDLKPSNLLVSRGAGGPKLRILDFGLLLRAGPADLADEALDRTLIGRSVTGTRGCGAPELAAAFAPVSAQAGLPPGPAADIYALGRCACLALFGAARPGDGQWTTAPLHTLLQACLAEAPKDRPDAAKLLAGLEGLAEQASAPAPRPPAATKGGGGAEAGGSLLDKVQQARAQAAEVARLRLEAERHLGRLDFPRVEEALRGILALQPEDEEAQEALAHLQAHRGPQAPRGTGRPSEEEVLTVLRRFQPQADLHVAPEIPRRKLGTARRICALPEDERVLGLIDCTVFGGASDVVLLTERGVHHRNMVDATPGPRFLPYTEFPARTFKAADGAFSAIDLGEGQLCHLTGTDMPQERVLALLGELRAWYPGT